MGLGHHGVSMQVRPAKSVPLWWVVLTMGQAMHVEGRGYMGNCNFPLVVNLNLFQKNSLEKKEQVDHCHLIL